MRFPRRRSSPPFRKVLMTAQPLAIRSVVEGCELSNRGSGLGLVLSRMGVVYGVRPRGLDTHLLERITADCHGQRESRVRVSSKTTFNDKLNGNRTKLTYSFPLSPQPQPHGLPTARKQRLIDSTRVLLDVAKESSDASPPLKSCSGGINALIKHYDVCSRQTVSPSLD